MTTYPRVPAKRILLSAFALTVLASGLHAANWPNWRGPNGDGTTSAANLPESWSTDKNVKWKVEMPAWSGSSPMVWGDKIFINTPSKEEAKVAEPAPQAEATPGKKKRPAPGMSRGLGMSGPGGQDILLMCLDRKTGKELWRQKYDQGNEIKMKQNMSSPTPVTDGKHVWVTSGNGLVACYDFAGKQQWSYDIPQHHGPIGIQFGYGSSPLLLDGKLVFQMLQGTVRSGIEHKPSFIFALDAATGKQLWKVERPTDAKHETPDSYSTPTTVTVGGKKQVVISGGGYVTGHDPLTGAELWRGGGLNPNDARNYRVISSPLVKGDMIFAPSRQTPLIAFKAGGKGDITDKAVWKWTSKGGPDVPTPVSDGERFYMVDDQGGIIALNAKTGEVVYGPEHTQIGRVSSSPVIADGKIYFVSETAETAVVEAGPKFRLISTNKLDGTYTLSTPAFVDGEIILRTGTHLYCIAKL